MVILTETAGPVQSSRVTTGSQRLQKKVTGRKGPGQKGEKIFYHLPSQNCQGTCQTKEGRVFFSIHTAWQLLPFPVK